MCVGAIFKATIPDESDEERRELERYVKQQFEKHSRLLHLTQIGAQCGIKEEIKGKER